MNDTPLHITKRLCEMLKKKSFEERYEMSWSMYHTSKELVTHAIKQKKVDITEAELKKELFLHFYKDDFDEDQIKKILAHLDKLS